LRSCGTVGKPDGNREDKHQPETLGETGLLTAGRSRGTEIPAEKKIFFFPWIRVRYNVVDEVD
jgi:hypothetical protein